MGKKMSKGIKSHKQTKLIPIIVAIAVVFVIFGSVALFSVLFKPGSKNVGSPLNAPTNINVYKTNTSNGNEYYVSYDAVEGAGQYLITIGDNVANGGTVFRHKSTSTVVNITKYINTAKVYKIGVQAINTSVSAYNSGFTYTTYSNSLNLTTPVLRQNHQVISWDKVSNATSYSLVLRYLDKTETVKLSSLNTSYDITNFILDAELSPTAVKFTVMVKAVYEGDLLITDSVYSQPVEYIVSKILDTPEVLFDSVTNILSWNEIAGASEYEIYLKKGNESYELIETLEASEETNFDFSAYILEADVGQYTGYIKAVSNEEYTIGSISENFEFKITTQIATPTIESATVDGEYLSVRFLPGDTLNLQSYYYLKVYNESDSLIYDARLTTLNFDFLLTVNNNGYYKITVTAKNDIFPDLYLDSEESEPFYISVETKIDTPENLVYTQPVIGSNANLNWSKIPSASSYCIELFTLNDEGQEVPFVTPIIQKSTTLTLPFTTAGFYYARVKALATESQFYSDSDFTEPVVCKFMEYIDAVSNLTISEDGTRLLFSAVENANSYSLYISGNLIEEGVTIEHISETTLAFVGIDTIFADEENYPSSETVPYTISVQAIASEMIDEVENVYASGKLTSILYYLIRTLDTPIGLNYVQTPNQNEASLTWYEVNNASNGYCVSINGTSPVALQRVLTTSVDVTPYLVPGINTFAVKANKCVNYNESESAVGNYSFAYYMQAATNFSVYTNEEDGVTNYYATFRTHKFANYYLMSFYATYGTTDVEKQLLGQQAVSEYYVNNDVVTIKLDSENIKKYDDCVTTIEFLTAYSDSFAGSTDPYFNSAYIYGDGKNSTFTKSVTSIYTYTNESVLVMIEDDDVTITAPTQVSRQISFVYPIGYAEKVRVFSVTVTRVDAINGNTYTTKTIAGSLGEVTADLNYLRYTILFDNLAIGEYTVTMYAVSAEQNISNSGKTYSQFTVTIVQDAPTYITIYKSITGHLLAQWDLISGHTTTTSYCATLYRYVESGSVVVQQWTSKKSTGQTIIRDGRNVNVIQIDLSTEKSATDRTKSVESNLISGYYYLTVQTNSYGEYYKESAVGTMPQSQYYSHNANISTPELIIDQDENAAMVVYDPELSYTLSYHASTTDNPHELNISYVTKTVSGTKYCVFNLLNAFTDEFDVGTYFLSVVSHKSVGSGTDATVIDSIRSELKSYRFMKNFDAPEVAASDVVYEYINNLDKATLETTINMVSVNGVTASDYTLRVYSGIFVYVITINIVFNDETGQYEISSLIDAQNNTYKTFVASSKVENGNVTTYTYLQSDDSLAYVLSVNSAENTIFVKIYDVSAFAANTTYYTIAYTLADEENYYKDSLNYGYVRFKFLLRWLPPKILFVTNDNFVINERRYVELNDENNYVNVKLDGSINGASTSYNYKIRATNLLTGNEYVYSLNKNKDIQNIANVGTAFKVDSSILSESGIYRIEFSIISSGKVESRYSAPLYIYNALRMDTPTITKIRKAATPVVEGKEKDINLQWVFDGYETLANPLKESTYFTITITETDENLVAVENGLSFELQIYLNDAELVKQGNVYSYIIPLENYPQLSTFIWIKATEDENHNPITVTHYKFTVTASSYETDLNETFNSEGIVSNGVANPLYVPNSATANFKYTFFAQSQSAVALLRCDNKLNTPENLVLTSFADDGYSIISWDEVFDPADSDTTVGYKYVYYQMGIDGIYWLNTYTGQRLIYFNEADNKFYTERSFNEGSELDINSLKTSFDETPDDNSFWLGTEDETFKNQFGVGTSQGPQVYGVWVFAYATNENASIGSSKVYFATVAYSETFDVPTEIIWSVSEDNATHTLTFDNTVYDQLKTSDIQRYLDVYKLTIGGYEVNWLSHNTQTLENENKTLSVTISQLYNLKYLTEYVDENGITRDRLYDWKLVAQDYSLTVYDPNETDGRKTYALYLSNEAVGQCYRSIIIERNVQNATSTIDGDKYYVNFDRISSATKYEMLFVNTNNEPILDNESWFTGGVVPENYVEKINLVLDYDNQYAYYTLNGKTVEVPFVLSGNRITVDFTALLNGRVAGSYYLAIYTLSDPEKFISLNGTSTLSSVAISYQKAYAQVENVEFSYDSEGILQTISWTEVHDSDGGLVHDFAYYRIQVWEKVAEGENFSLLTLSSSGDKMLNAVFSGVQGISGLNNVLSGSNIWYDTSNELDPRIYINIADIFKQYLVDTNGVRKGGVYTVGITVAPASSTKSSFSESTVATADFVHRVKLEFETNSDYVQFLVDGYLDESASVANREAVFTDGYTQDATIYLSDETVNGNFNIKALRILQWLPEIQSTEIAVYLKNSMGEWIETVRFTGIDLLRNYQVFLHEGAVQLKAGINQMAIQAVGINDYYVESNLKTFQVKAYFKHPTPTITLNSNVDIVYENSSTSFAGTPTKLTLHLDDSWASKNYGVVVYAYYYKDGVYEPYLAWQTSDATGDEENNRLVWTMLNGTACFVYPMTYTKNVALRGKVVNFMDFFYANAGQTYGSNEMVSLVGSFDYVFRAKIFARKSYSAENYYLNSEFSEPTEVFSYTYQLEKPKLRAYGIQNGLPVYEFVQRDALSNAVAVNVAWQIDDVKFKSILKYSITVWDGQNRVSEPFSRGNGNPYNSGNTVEYSAYIKVYFSPGSTTANYSLYSVTVKNYKGTENTVLESAFNNYFTISGNYVVFNMMPFINSIQRINQYVAGVYRYHIKAVLGKVAELSATSANYVTSSYINQSGFTGTFYANSDVDVDYNYYTSYTHSVPYPVGFTIANVNSSGILSMTLQDSYATARTIYITVNDAQTTYIIESPTSNSTTYYSNISSLLIPGLTNVVKVKIGAVEYYFDGAEKTATADFTEWVHEIGEVRNLTWAYNAGRQEISYNVSFSDKYAEQPALDSGDGVLDADRVHFKIDVLYSSTQIEYNTALTTPEIYEFLATQGSILHFTANDLNNVGGKSYVKFRPTVKSYRFDLLACVSSIYSNFIEDEALKGGFYSLKLTMTVKDEDGVSPSGAENYLDYSVYIIQKQIFSPWKMSASGDFWSDQTNYLTTSVQSPANDVKELWADNKDINWGICFDVTPVSSQYPLSYRVFYWRDDSTLPYDNYFDVTGDNISVVSGKVYLNFKTGFGAVSQAGVYNFAWMAMGTAGLAESSRYSYILTALGAETVGLSDSLSKYKGYGLANYVRVSTPELATELSNQSKTSCTITWTYVDTTGESKSNLSFSAKLKNFVGSSFTNGQSYPTNIAGFGPVAPSEERRYIYQSNGDTTLNMQDGDNFVSIQAIPAGNNSYYLSSNWSNLRRLTWAVTLPAPTINVYLSDLESQDLWQGLQKKTVPENESVISSDIVNHYDTVDRGGTRETQGNATTFTGNITIESKVGKNAVVNNTAYIEIMTFDPVTNALYTQSNALCHFLVRADISEGIVYRHLKKTVDYSNNATNSSAWVSDGQSQIGTCRQNTDGSVTLYVYGLKIYEMFPTVTYSNVLVKNSDNASVLYSGVKNFADIPQTYRFIVRSFTDEAISEDAGFNYDYSLRLIAPEVTEVNFNGSSIKSLNGQKYISNDLQQDYAITLSIDKVSRNAEYLLLYGFVDQTNGNNYYNEERDNNANYDTDNYEQLRSNCLIFDIRGKVSYETVYSTYGTVVLTIEKNTDLWTFINENTPNTFYFAAQAVSSTAEATDFTVYEGDFYDDYTIDIPELKSMTLRYSESYIGQYKQCIIFRQFEKAVVNLKLDYGHVTGTSEPTSLKDSNTLKNVDNIATNLSTSNMALDPYLVLEENDYANTKLSHEYTESKKYAGYEITATLPDGTSKQKTIYSISGELSDGSGLMDAEDCFDELVLANNPVRYTFNGSVYNEITILEDPAIYKLLLSLFETKGSGASLKGGQCTISIRAIREERTTISQSHNFWVSQDTDGKNSIEYLFYLRPSAVKLTLQNAVFNTSNPLVVDWSSTMNENELLYPNSVNLSWTASSDYISTYKIDITRVEASNSLYKYSYNQGAAAFSGTSQNLAAPTGNWGGDSNIYGELMSSKRFNNWDERSADIEIALAVTYQIFIDTNEILTNFVGRSYTSGESEGTSTTNYTYYNVQLKYNVYNGIVITSATDGNLGSGEPSAQNFKALSFSTTTNGNTGSTISLGYTSKFDQIGATVFTVTGPFSYTNRNGTFTAVEAVKEGEFDGFSPTGFKAALNDLMELNNAAGGVYTITYHFTFSTTENPTPTTPFLQSEESNTFQYTYYRNVFASTVKLTEETHDVLVSAESDDGDYAAFFKIRIWQVNASTGGTKKPYDVGNFSLKSSVGLTQTSVTGSYTHDFIDTKADALSDTTISSASKFIYSNYTYYTGALQAGLNTYSVIITAGDPTYNIQCESEQEDIEFTIPSQYAPKITRVDLNQNGSKTEFDYCSNATAKGPSDASGSASGGGSSGTNTTACLTCKGTGKVTCPNCNGNGFTEKKSGIFNIDTTYYGCTTCEDPKGSGSKYVSGIGLGNNDNMVKGSGSVKCKDCGGTGSIKVEEEGGGGGGGESSAGSMYTFSQTWHYANIRSMPTYLSFVVYNSFAYSYSLEYDYYTQGSGSGTGGSYVTYSKSTTSVVRNISGLTYNVSKSGFPVDSSSFNSTCFWVRDTVVTASCKKGFDEYIDGDWGSDPGTVVDDSNSDVRASVGSGSSFEQQFASFTVLVSGPLEGTLGCDSSATVTFSATGKGSQTAFSRALPSASNITITLTGQGNHTWTKTTTQYTDTSHYEGSGKNQHWVQSYDTSVTTDNPSKSETVTVTLNLSLANPQASASTTATGTFTKQRDADQSGSPPSGTDIKNTGEQVEYKFEPKFAWSVSPTGTSVPTSGDYVPAAESSSGLRSFLFS